MFPTVLCVSVDAHHGLDRNISQIAVHDQANNAHVYGVDVRHSSQICFRRELFSFQSV